MRKNRAKNGKMMLEIKDKKWNRIQHKLSLVKDQLIFQINLCYLINMI